MAEEDRPRAAPKQADPISVAREPEVAPKWSLSVSAYLEDAKLGPLGRAQRDAELLRKLEAIRTDLDKLQAERDALDRTREKELAARRAAPRPQVNWAWMTLVAFAKHGESNPGNAHARVAAAYKAGWIVERPSDELRAALAALDHQTLWEVLHLDGNAPNWPANVKRDLKHWREEEKRTRGLLGSAREIEQVLSTRAPDAAMTVVAELQAAANYAWLSRRMLESFAAAVDEESRPRTIVRLRETVLARLLAVLQSVERSWSIPKLAALILASSQDFTYPPCPRLVRKYRDREDGEHDLTEMLKKRLRRTGKNRA